MATEVKQKVKREELPVLSGKLSYLEFMVSVERKVAGEKSYGYISQTMERVIIECNNIADRLLFAGLEEEK